MHGVSVIPERAQANSMKRVNYKKTAPTLVTVSTYNAYMYEITIKYGRKGYQPNIFTSPTTMNKCPVHKSESAYSSRIT